VILLSRLALELYSANEPIDRRASVIEEAVAVARRIDDQRALVTAFHARYWTLTVPEMVDERLAYTREMLEAAEQTGDREMEFLAHNARFHRFLELGDGRGLDKEMEAMTGVADLIRQPSYLWHTLCLRVVRAILDARYADAEELAAKALDLGRLRQSEYPTYVFQYAQLFAIRWAQGRLGELWPTIRGHADLYPWIPRWRDALAAAELGDRRAARTEVARHARENFADIPRDGLWLLHLCALAEACVLIRDEPRGRLLYELLLPHADRNAVSYTQQPFGPVALRLGMLATVLREWDAAERHFSTTRECCEHLGARGVVPRVLYEHARMLVARGQTDDGREAAARLAEAADLCDELDIVGLGERIGALRLELSLDATATTAIFRREGEIWMVGYGGDSFRLRDVKGLRYIGLLLGSPAREIHSVELAHAVEGVVEPSRLDDGVGPALDAEAKNAYRRRLEELGEELEEARAWADPERAARAEAEVDALTTELTKALGLGGRDRPARSAAERARVSVTKAIRSAIKTIEGHSPALGEHLAVSIRTGRFCSYAPPGELPPRWHL
jgi:hypothetical protein